MALAEEQPHSEALPQGDDALTVSIQCSSVIGPAATDNAAQGNCLPSVKVLLQGEHVQVDLPHLHIAEHS